MKKGKRISFVAVIIVCLAGMAAYVHFVTKGTISSSVQEWGNPSMVLVAGFVIWLFVQVIFANKKRKEG